MELYIYELYFNGEMINRQFRRSKQISNKLYGSACYEEKRSKVGRESDGGWGDRLTSGEGLPHRAQQLKKLQVQSRKNNS